MVFRSGILRFKHIMALEKDTQVSAFGATAPLYFVPGDVRLDRLAATALIIPHGYASKAAWETAKTCHALRAKQEREQKQWRLERTAWEAAHAQWQLEKAAWLQAGHEESDFATLEPVLRAEPFETIPPMPPFLPGEPLTLQHDDYLAFEAAIKGGQNFYAALYTVLKNPAVCAQFIGAVDV